jgi:hypothetical protein
MGYTQRLTWELLRSVNSASLAGVYVPIGGPLLHPAVIVKMVNNSNSLVTVSFDGVNDYDVCPANSFWLYDETLSGYPTLEALPEGTQLFVNGAAGTGLIYLVVQYVVTN